MEELISLLEELVTNTDDDVKAEDTRRRLAEIIKQGEENDTRTDVNDGNDYSNVIGMLGPKADNTQIINKINELINDFNKTLRDYRI